VARYWISVAARADTASVIVTGELDGRALGRLYEALRQALEARPTVLTVEVDVEGLVEPAVDLLAGAAQRATTQSCRVVIRVVNPDLKCLLERDGRFATVEIDEVC